MNFKGKRVIVYGLGKQYQRQKQFLESEFDIVGLSDKKQLNIQGYIKPENISTCDFDYLPESVKLKRYEP